MSGMVGWEYWVLLLSSQLIEWWFHAGKGKPSRQEATAPLHHASHNTGMSLGDKQPTVPYYRSRAVAQDLCPGREAVVKTQVSLWDFPGGSDGKTSAYNVGDPGSIPGWGRSPGEGNATHSSILAWKIPCREESGRLQSMGSQRVRHDWATSLTHSL